MTSEQDDTLPPPPTTTTTTTIDSDQKRRHHTFTEALLVNGPTCQQPRDDGDVLSVEPGNCCVVNISPAQPPRTQRILPAAPIITTTAAMLVQSLSICKNQQEKEQEEHELVEHPVVSSSYYYTTPTDSHDQNHDSKKTNFIVVTDAAQDYGYKYEFCHSQPPSTSSLQDGNCWQAPSEQNDSSFDDDDDHSEPFLDHYYQSNSADLPFGSSMQINANKQQQISSSLVSPAASDPCVYLLGSAYHPALDYERQRNHELSLYWFTYRSDFPEIAPYHITCDAGWGCMLRSAQMLLAQALRVHFKSRNYSSHHLSLAQKRREPFLRSLLIWMADLTLKDSVYSLHNMVATGMAKYEILPGEWYGPGSACHVLRDLVHAHEAKQLALWTKKQQHRQEQEGGGGGGGRAKDESTKTTTYSPNKPVRVFRVHVASQGTVYYDAVRELMTQESRSEFEQQQQQQQQQSSISATKQQQEDMPEHPLATAAEDLQKEVQYQQALERLEWDTGLLLLIPLRLGLQTGITEEYAKSLAYIFSLPQSVGVLGGRPRGARWFYGAWSDGSKILGLDPHTVQAAPRRRKARVNGKETYVVDISEEYLRSVHTTSTETVSMLRMDPSIALGFYCRTAQEFQDLQNKMEQWRLANPKVPQLFTFAEHSPDYANGGNPMMDDLVTGGMTGSSFLDEDGENRSNASDEEDFVFL